MFASSDKRRRSDSGDSAVVAAMQDKSTPINQADARHTNGADELQAFQLWVAGDVASDAEGEPCSEMSVLRVGDVITYRIVELSAAG